MKRESKTVFTADAGYDLLSIKNGKVSIECGYRNFDADMLDELVSAASAAAEELRATTPTESNGVAVAAEGHS
jgi:hypothetical protein